MSDDGIDWDIHAVDAQSFKDFPNHKEDTFKSLPIEGKLLDLGSCICRWYPAFRGLKQDYNRNIDYHAYDRSEVAKGIVASLYPEVDFVTGEIFELSQHFEQGNFDVVFSSAFLQHFSNENKAKILSEVAKILKSKGLLITNEGYFSDGPADYTNDRMFSISGWHKFMSDNGFNPSSVRIPYLIYQLR